MGLIEIYLIFALTTSITCCLIFFLPILSEARGTGINNEFTRYPVISTITYIVISTIMAPFLILPILFESKAEEFRRGLRNSVMSTED